MASPRAALACGRADTAAPVTGTTERLTSFVSESEYYIAFEFDKVFMKSKRVNIYFKEGTNELSNGFPLFLQLLLSLIIIGELPDISEKDN